MRGDSHDFGHAELVDAEAIGQPGERRFRIFARSPRGTASLWLEKEQLAELARAIDQLLSVGAEIPVLRTEVQVPTPSLPSAPDDFPAHPDVEFQVGQMQIGLDEEHGVLVLRASPIELVEPEGDSEAAVADDAAFSAYMSRGQADRLATHIIAVVGAGRPRCPLCGMPMQPEHVCEKQNGFHPIGLN